MVDLKEGRTQKKERPEEYLDAGLHAGQSQRSAPSATRDSTPYLADGRAQRKARPETYPKADPHAMRTDTLAIPSIGDSVQYLKYTPSTRSLLLFLGGIAFSFCLLLFQQPTSPTCAPADANAPAVDVPEVTIAVMGATGSGKSTFINLISGSNFGVGNGLRSFTNTVEPTHTFHRDDRRVILIDTPGFDDTSLSDTDVLNLVASFLANSYEQGKTLAGVLYFYRISDFKMTGVSRRNFGMFRKLCGDNVLKNVVIVTNMWGGVDPDVGNKREVELKTEDDFFKPVLEKGAHMARHENTRLSAENIIRLILKNHPLPLRIQEELVKEHKDISDTDAGGELNRGFDSQIKKHEEGMRNLREQMENAMRDKDEELRRELEGEMKGLKEKIEGLQSDKERLESDYRQRIARLRKAFRASEGDRVKMEEEIKKLKEDANRPSWLGFFGKGFF